MTNHFAFCREELHKNRSMSLPMNISATYSDWDEILHWIENVKSKKFSKIVISKTYEKRDIFILRPKTHSKNPIVFIVGGEDGMDWTSSAVILNLFNDILNNSDDLKMLLDNFNFYLLPILNPDGFVYSKIQV